jgi:hypothetical protein
MKTIKFHPFSDKTINFAARPQPSSKHLPEWYRNQSAIIDDKNDLAKGMVASTVKKCMPVFDIMTAGYMLTAPCDIFIDATNPEKLVYSIPMGLRQFQGDIFATHAREQYEEYPIDKRRSHKDLLRVYPFWSIETPSGYSCMFVNPMHADISPLTAIPGIVDTDSFVTNGHLSFIVESNFKGTIKQGTPLVQVIPFKREPWASSVVDPSEAAEKMEKQRLDLRSTFVNGYKNKFRAKKEYK